MAIEYIKKAAKTSATGEDNTRDVVVKMLNEIEAGGEGKALEYAKQLDGWEGGNPVMTREQIDAAIAKVSQQEKDEIKFSCDRVSKFAQHQRDSMVEFETEPSPDLFAGQKLITINTAGCYVSGGRYAHIASAIMSVATAKVAGVENVVACSVPHGSEGIHPAIVYAMDLSGADTIVAMGGVQGVAAMVFGLFTGNPADSLVGPGNRFVAEAKRLLFGRVGIEVFAGPTEIAIIADETADPEIVASDLAGQAEHGPDSLAWLFTESRELADKVIEIMSKHIDSLSQVQREAATAAWRDYDEVILCDTREEAATISDQCAGEHLEVQAKDLDWWPGRLKNYGSLFVGEEATVPFGDKCSGTSHILPTKGADRYTGGLSAAKFIKVITYQANPAKRFVKWAQPVLAFHVARAWKVTPVPAIFDWRSTSLMKRLTWGNCARPEFSGRLSQAD